MEITLKFDTNDDKEVHDARKIVDKLHYRSPTRRITKVQLIIAIRTAAKTVPCGKDTNFPMFSFNIGLKEAKKLADIIWDNF